MEGDKQVYPKMVGGKMIPGTTKRQSQRKKKYNPDFQPDPVEVWKREHVRLSAMEKEDAIKLGDPIEIVTSWFTPQRRNQQP